MPEMLTPDRERPLRAEDEAKLRTLLGLKDTDELPSEIKDAYWQHARLWQRLGYTMMADALLVSIVIQGKCTAPAPAVIPWLVAAVQDGSIKAESTVQVRIGNKKKPAKFIRLGAGNDRARVHVEGDGDERLVPVADVLGAAT